MNSETPASPVSKKSLMPIGILVFTVFLVMLCLGVICGAAFYAIAPGQTKYKSVATIMIEAISMSPRNSAISQNTPHHQVIASKEFIKQTFDIERLYRLGAFSSMNKADAVRYTVKNLQVEKDKEEATIYYLEFACRDKKDCQVVLYSLIESYRRRLDNEFSDKRDRVADVIRETMYRLEEQYKDTQQQVAIINEKLQEYKTENADEETIRSAQAKYDSAKRELELHEKLLHEAKAKFQRTELDQFQQQDRIRFQILSSPDEGERVRFSLVACLTLGAAGGLLLGTLLSCTIFFVWSVRKA